MSYDGVISISPRNCKGETCSSGSSCPSLFIKYDRKFLFSISYSFRPHYGPGVDSASNRNEYRVYLLEVKAAGA